MSTRTQALILLLFGAALVRLGISDALLRYVRPSARGWVLLAGATILVVALCNLLSRPAESVAGGCHPAAPGRSAGPDMHKHSAVTRLAWLVLAPVLAVLVVAPPALGSFSAAREPVHVRQPARAGFPPLPAGNPAPESVLDFATRVSWDDGRTVIGRPVRLTGFVLADNEQGFILTRLVISCCAADAQPVNIQILDPAVHFSRNSWVSVTGTYAGVDSRKTTVAQLRASSVLIVSAPANPYDD